MSCKNLLSGSYVLQEADLTVEKLDHSAVSILPSFIFECKLQALFLLSLMPLNILSNAKAQRGCLLLLCTYSPVKTKQTIKILDKGVPLPVLYLPSSVSHFLCIHIHIMKGNNDQCFNGAF